MEVQKRASLTNSRASTKKRKYTTDFQAEVSGIMRAVAEVLRRNIVNKAIRISSDNKAALHALGGYEITSGVVLQYRHVLESHNNIKKLYGRFSMD